jgi:hypothetical protein
MGYVTIPLDGITPGTPVDKWLPVKPRKSKDKVSGEIHVYFLYSQNKVQKEIPSAIHPFLIKLLLVRVLEGNVSG